MSRVPPLDLGETKTKETSPQLSPRSPRLVAIVDSPRPSSTTVQRRLSQTHAPALKNSPLRFSLSDTALTKYLTSAQKDSNQPEIKDICSVAESSCADNGVSSSSSSSSEDEEQINSPLNGMLDTFIAPLYLLEQTFQTPGGGIELKQVLGVYTSKRAAEHAARVYLNNNHDVREHFEHVRLCISAVSVDKAASKHHEKHDVHF